MANKLNGFLDNFFNGATNPGGNLRDAQHAQRLYVDNAFRLSPKVKFLYFVVFNISSEALASDAMKKISSRHRAEINMLVKEVDLPGYSVEVTTKNQYNRKKNVQTSINYDPVNVKFHDDNLGVTTALLEAYYRYYFQDGSYNDSGSYNPRNTYNGEESHTFKYGLDTSRVTPFFSNIQVFQLSKQEFTAFTLINPVIQKWQHDTMTQTDSSGIAENSMSLLYESVRYERGSVQEDNPATFATSHYDTVPSPLTPVGGGTRSIFGAGGLFDGGSEVLGDLLSGDVGFDTLLTGANLIKNASRLTKEGIIEEGFSVIGRALQGSGSDEPGGLIDTVFPTTPGSSLLNTIEATASDITNGLTTEIKTEYARASNGLSNLLSDNPFTNLFD